MSSASTGLAGLDRSLRALAASALAAVPLCELFTDRGWLIEAWFAMFIVLAPALLMRLVRPPSALDVWPGLVLLVFWLTAVYVPAHAWAGFVPLDATWQDVGAKMTELHETMREGVAPLHTTVPVKLALCALLGLLAALIDLIAVVGRHAALGGIPLLIIFTLAGAVTRHPVGWLLFACGAASFLLLLSIDAHSAVRDWGRLIPRAGGSRAGIGRGGGVLAVSGQRIAVVSIVLALLLPLFAPAHPTNLLSNALHSRGSGGGFGAGGGGSSIDPFAALKGQLDRSKPADLATVELAYPPGANPRPFYLRVNVLSDYVGDGWAPADHGETTTVADGRFDTVPAGPSDAAHTEFTARITVSGMRGNPAVFAQPIRISGLDDAQWSAKDQLVLGVKLHDGQSYLEQVSQPEPTVAALDAAPAGYSPRLGPWLEKPKVPRSVDALVAKVVKNSGAKPYAKARAISNFFTDPANGFSYSLSTVAGDSGSDLVDFLTNRVGYCQQYAAAMAVMLRLAGVPSRVVLGYTHVKPDKDGTFEITTNDAHAWVEAYFNTIGWVPFDPTPLAGINGGSANALPWAPHGGASPTATGTAPAGADQTHPHPGQTSTSAAPSKTAAAAAPTPTHRDRTPLWAGLGLVALVCALALTPAGIRARRRRARLAAGRRGDPLALWAELSDTALDLGFAWSRARTPRQVVGWLDGPAGSARTALARLADAVERRDYGPPSPAAHAGSTGGLDADLRAVREQLWAGRSASVRARAWLWPASLAWWPLTRGGSRRKH